MTAATWDEDLPAGRAETVGLRPGDGHPDRATVDPQPLHAVRAGPKVANDVHPSLTPGSARHVGMS